jgi:hypothetical protein
MPVVPVDSLNVSGLVWTIKLLPSKHPQTSKWHGVPFSSTVWRPARILLRFKPYQV